MALSSAPTTTPTHTAPNASLWHRIEPLLNEVERPARYINHELFAASPCQDTKENAVDFVWVYPDTYEIGQSNQAIAILYDVMRRLPGVTVERAYLPWLDMISKLREQDIPLFSLESCRGLRSFDIVGITLPHELSYTNILEVLDLANIPLYAAKRTQNDPIIFGGGPCAYNPEPIAPFFDAFCIGEGEEFIVEFTEVYQQAKAAGLNRTETLKRLAVLEGMYVPAFHKPRAEEQANASITKRVVANFDALPVVAFPLVPFAEIAHDRLAIEILRGCTRGCRFCQAGMLYRPVRERSADTVVRAVVEGLAQTGYSEVSLTSLSSTDHSQIAEILTRLNHCLDKQGVRLGLPSQRVDGFGVKMAQLVAGGERKSGLTFAPEAGTQRLRDVINKNVTEEDLIEAISSAYAAGWRRCKLYFMIGLPGENDDDVRGITALANKAYQAAKDAVDDTQRGNCRMSISVAVFIPKPHTPFQWCGYLEPAEIERRIELLRSSGLHRGIDLQWHDPSSGLIEAAMARGGRTLASVIEGAWRNGARFDAWSEQFDLNAWKTAADEGSVSLEAIAQQSLHVNDPLPWDHISTGVDKSYLWQEYEQARAGEVTPDCSFEYCTSCGVCSACDADIRLGGASRA